MPRYYIPIGGTWADRDSWMLPRSAWGKVLADQGWTPASEEPFEWSYDLDGVLLDRLTGRKHRDWIAAAASLHYYLKDVPYHARTIFAHSHAAQVVAYCAAHHGHETPIRCVYTICSPVRGDMMDVYRKAKPYIHHWVHLWAPGWKNRMQWLGELFDGHLGFQATMPPADHNIRLSSKAGHGGVLRDEFFLLQWPVWLAYA